MQEDGKNPDCVRPLISIDLDKFKQVNDSAQPMNNRVPVP
jgi:GGDEF domain-containing protein